MKVTPRQLSRDFLEPYIKLRKKHRGFTRHLVVVMAEMTGESVHRQEIEKWLCAKESDRVEPRLGVALALVRAANELAAREGLEVK